VASSSTLPNFVPQPPAATASYNPVASRITKLSEAVNRYLHRIGSASTCRPLRHSFATHLYERSDLPDGRQFGVEP